MQLLTIWRQIHSDYVGILEWLLPLLFSGCCYCLPKRHHVDQYSNVAVVGNIMKNYYDPTQKSGDCGMFWREYSLFSVFIIIIIIFFLSSWFFHKIINNNTTHGVFSDVIWVSLSYTKRSSHEDNIMMWIVVIFVVHVIIIVFFTITKRKNHAFLSKYAAKHVDIAIINNLNTTPWQFCGVL